MYKYVSKKEVKGPLVQFCRAVESDSWHQTTRTRGHSRLFPEILGNHWQFTCFADRKILSILSGCPWPCQAYCYVSPPAAGRQSMRARLAAGDDFGIRPIPVELPSYAGVQDGPSTFELAEEG